ncbi:unnamed protein product [Agarophyton chilense]
MEFGYLVPIDFPNTSSLRILKHCSWGNGGPFQCLLQYAGVFYNFLLEFNEDDSESAVNRSLQKIYIGLAKKDYGVMDEGARDCLGIFLPFLRQEYERRLASGLNTDALDNTGDLKFVKIRLTSVNGSLRVQEHEKELIYDFEAGKPIGNPFPHLRLLKDPQIERLEELGPHMFKVRINGKECFLKKAYCADPDSFLREFEILAKLPSHSNVVSLFGVTDAGGGKIDGLVITPFIHGTSLEETTMATASQKVKWKKQISDAIRFLHSFEVVWGDAAPQNIMIDEKEDRAIIIDFGGGISKPWIDDDLYETKQGDLQGVGRLHDYIDRLQETEG